MGDGDATPGRSPEREPADVELYRAIVEGAADAILAVDADGIIRVANARALALFGYSRAELIGADLEQLVPARVRDVHRSHRADFARTSHARLLDSGLTLTAITKDGTEFPVDIALSPTGTTDGTLVIASIRDISARVAAEREARRLQEEIYQARFRQAERIETIGQLAGGIAHDFNNLLAVILNYADFLTQDLPEGQQRQDVEEIQRAASRAADLTRQLLIFARREIAKPEVLDVNEVVLGVEKLVRRTVGENIDFVTSLATGLPTVVIDPGQLEQVFMNLAVNARDAMPSGGRLVVETQAVELDDLYVETHPGVAPGAYVRLSVSDTGTGMAPEVVARAFEPFFTTKPAGSGTGLGLSTVYGIVTRAGGNVRIYSEVGKGTVVAIHLPANDAPVSDAARRSTEHEGPRGRGETVLVVEDEPAMLLSTIRILSANGYRVFAQSKPEDALALLAHAEPRVDLLLTDVVMPVLSGAELARRARASRPDLRVVFMSGYSNEVVSHHADYDAGSAMLQKPFTRSALLATVRATLDAGGTA
jgi:PAS domain S-box-containing protein